MPYPTLLPNNSWYKSSYAKKSITQVNIANSYTPTGGENESWNADVNTTGSIKCYRTGTVLTIAGNGSGKIYANADSLNVFNGFMSAVSFLGIELMDTSKATTFEKMFYDCNAVQHLDLRSWNTSNLTSLKNMFNGALGLKTVLVDGWNTSNVTNMRGVFACCVELTEVDLTGWTTGKVTEMSRLFMGMTDYGGPMKLTKIKGIADWDVSKVETMEAIFQLCNRITSLDVGRWKPKCCTSITNAFYKCESLPEVNVSNWDVSKVEDFESVFAFCESLRVLDLSGWDTHSATNMKQMLACGKKLEKLALGTDFMFVGNDYLLGYVAATWYDIDKDPVAADAIPDGAGTYFSSAAVADREAAELMLVTQGSLLRTAKAIRIKTEETTGYKPSEFPDAIRSIVGGEIASGPVPAGANVKYIIPATYTPLRTSDGFGFDAFKFTFTRENTNQLFYVLWRLQDVGDFNAPGYWISSITWELTQQGNYNSQHNLFVTAQGAGKGGNLAPTSIISNVAKSAITASISVAALKGSGESYARLGQLYKGLIVVTDSTYTGEPIVDGTKLGQYFSNIDTLTAGWGE